MTEDHKHVWKPAEQVIRLHNYRKDQGKPQAVDMTARDTLKQFVCTCGKVETHDLVRVKLV